MEMSSQLLFTRGVTHSMVKINRQIIFTSLRMMDPNAISFVTTMLLASIILMTQKSDPGTGSVHYFIVPLTLLPSGRYSAPSQLEEHRRITCISKTKAKETKMDGGPRSYSVPRRELHLGSNLHLIRRPLSQEPLRTPTLTKVMALLKMRFSLFLPRPLMTLKKIFYNRKPCRKAL